MRFSGLDTLLVIKQFCLCIAAYRYPTWCR